MEPVEFRSKALQAVFFDVDGVLIDSLDVKGDCFARVFNDFPEKSLQIRDWHLKNGGLNRIDKIRAIAKDVIGISSSDREVEDRAEEFSKLVVNQVKVAPEIPGAGHALSQLQGRALLFAASATPQDELRRILSARGDEHFFAEIFGWPISKKTAITTMLGKHSLSPSSTVLVGDSIQDYESAQDAGVRFIYVMGHTNHRPCPADAYIKNLTSLLPALEQVTRRDWEK